jgi:uncharacterized protein RhaS with RHS repeats
LTTVTDALGRTTTRVNDAAGRPVRITDPLGRSTQYSYDALGYNIDSAALVLK